jgi:hypothetical protein
METFFSHADLEAINDAFVSGATATNPSLCLQARLHHI